MGNLRERAYHLMAAYHVSTNLTTDVNLVYPRKAGVRFTSLQQTNGTFGHADNILIQCECKTKL